MSTTPRGSYEPPDLITLAWIIDYWLIYANTHVLSQTIATNVSVLTRITVTTELDSWIVMQV